jgi:uroporphyrinogen-III decarboxylase
MNDRIETLIGKYLDIVHSPKNEGRKRFWRDPCRWNRDMWRGIPVRSSAADPVPFTIALDNSLWTHILGFSLIDYYHDPETFLEVQLKKQIYSFENFDDDTCYTDELFIWFGVITELSILGAKIEWFPYKEGWIEGTVLKGPEDLGGRPYPDFRTSGLMPRILKYYEVLSEHAKGRLTVMFPEWVRGPLCLAMHLRGISDILVDSQVDQEFFHRLMRFTTEAKKNWDGEREKFLGEKLSSCKLYNDEIDCPTLSPALYRDMIFPYEKELGELYGGVKYWHSCGNTTAFQEQIRKLPNLGLYHCGPWSDFGNAVRVMGRDVGIDLCINPQKDVVEAAEAEMRRTLLDIRKTGGDAAYSVRADAFMVTGTYDRSLLEKIKIWNRVAREVLSGR